MSAATKMAALYAAIPAFDCKPGCSDCCGVVPMAMSEWQSIKMVERVESGCLNCGYLVDDKCSVYADRPFLCRLFGATTEAKMACPHGCGPANPLTPKQAGILTSKYARLMGARPAAFTVDIAALRGAA